MSAQSFLAAAGAYEPRDAFVYAASLNQVEVVRRWLSRQLDVNQLDREGNSALCAAAQNQCMEVIELLLRAGANVDQPQCDGMTALHVASKWGKLDAANRLLARHASINARDNDGMTPLHYASRNGHEDIVQALLDAGADLFVADQFGAIPSEMASDWQRLEILRMIRAWVKMAPSLSAMLLVDLSSLHADAVLQYVDKVLQLQPQRNSVSAEKLQMLFVLTQKLLKWLVDERSERQETNERLQHQLLSVIKSAAETLPPVESAPCRCESSKHEIADTPQSPPTEPKIQPAVEVAQNVAALDEIPTPQGSQEVPWIQVEQASSVDDREINLQSPSTSCGSTEASDGPIGGWQVFPEDPTQLYIMSTTESCPPPLEEETGDETEPPQHQLTIMVPTPEDLVKHYWIVHIAVTRLQKVARGFVTRRRFWNLLEELMQDDNTD